jgi:hypothetical protein
MFECGARAVPVAWTVKDKKGELLTRFLAGSPREVARKIVRSRYDAFRLEVSPFLSRSVRSRPQDRARTRGLADSPPQASHPEAPPQQRPAELELKLKLN